MQDKELWMKRSKELLALAGKVNAELGQGSVAPEKILSAMFIKGMRTFEAIRWLYTKNLPERGQVLVRVLFELRLDFYEFIRLCQIDSVVATRRLLDAMGLEKIKQQRESKFKGLELVEGAPTPKQLLQEERNICSRYDEKEIRKLRRFGFSEMSIENRAKKAGLSEIYHVVFRNFSRNVHSTDYAEHLGKQSSSKLSTFPDYEDLRDHVSMSQAITSMWQLCYHGGAIAFRDEFLSSGVLIDLMRIGQKCTEMTHWVHMEDEPVNEAHENTHAEGE
ncbi:MAG: hypothetical protein GY789_10800 [Hyphomicrobiales bacterium]|nr:hypothetical protein [Hyphomicrobiales bacterium]